MHQPWGGAEGSASDISIKAKEIKRLKSTLTTILAKHTGQEFARLEQDTDRDYYMSPEEAKEYGIVDEIILPLKKSKKEKQEDK